MQVFGGLYNAQWHRQQRFKL